MNTRIKLAFMLAALVLMCIPVYGAFVVINPRNTTIVLHPNETHTYYYIDRILGSTTPIVVDSQYIVISGIPFEVVSDGPVNVYINAWNPENIAKPGSTLFNFTVSTLYHTQTVTFNLGNLPDVPLMVYKDGKPFVVAVPSNESSFYGNVPIRVKHCFRFSDGLKVASSIESNITSVVSKHVGSVTVMGKVVKVMHTNKGVYVTLNTGKKYVRVKLPAKINVTPNTEVIVQGMMHRMNKTPVILMRRMYFHKPSGFSTHTYVIKTVVPASLPKSAINFTPVTNQQSNQFVGSAPPSAKYIGYAVLGAVVIPIGFIAYVVYKRFKGY